MAIDDFESNISEAELMAYIDGDLSPERSAKIEAELKLKAEAEELKGIGYLFKAAFFRFNCPSSDDLLEFVAGLLSKKEKNLISTHLETCNFCTKEINKLTSDDLVTQNYAQDHSWQRLVKEGGKTIIEGLLRPSPKQAPQLRGEKDEFLVFDAPPFQISIVIRPPLFEEMGWTIEGQIFDPESPFWDSSPELVLFFNGKKIATQSINSYGYFLIDELEPGNYIGYFLVTGLRVYIEFELVDLNNP